MDASFGELIKHARQAKRLSRKELASRLLWSEGRALSAQYLANLEGDYRQPADELIYLLARELNIPSDLLFHRLHRLPPDIRLLQPGATTILAAYTLMRETLKNGETLHATQ